MRSDARKRTAETTPAAPLTADKATLTEDEPATIYNDGGPIPERGCPNHTHRRPIHPGTLTKYMYVREQREREHRYHYMPEAGCPLCLLPAEEALRPALLGLPRYKVAPQQVGILVQHEIRHPEPVEVVRLSDLTSMIDALYSPVQSSDGGDA